tara:strand:- start:204 stop:725 length:522 start_codon:yes stop_codon:yes gene_type:complete
MEMMQVGFLVVGIFILWSSMNLTAPAPVTPNDVTGELNSMLEFIQKLRKRETAKAGSDRRKQEQMDKIFEEVEEQIEDLLASIEAKGNIMKTRNETDALEYASGWATLEQELSSIMQTFEVRIAHMRQSFGSMAEIHSALTQSQDDVFALQEQMNLQIQSSNQLLSKIYQMYN